MGSEVGAAGDPPREALERILKIGRARGLGPADIEGMSARAFGRKPGQLNRAEASNLIKELTNLRRQTA